MAGLDPEAVDTHLRCWRQGDCVVDDQWFLFRTDPSLPLTEAGHAAAEDDADAAEIQVPGFVVLTQTCDIVRPCWDRPFIEVCPLVEVGGKDLDEIRRYVRPRYAFIPGVADMGLVADLDRVMTVEKSVVASWDRREGCAADDERRALRAALERKVTRTAFPDDFVLVAARLQDRLKSKHNRQSPEGSALRALREIRVRAAPSWDAEEVVLTFYFIRKEDEASFEGTGWDEHLDRWLGLVTAHGRFTDVYGLVVTLDDMTARDHVESDRLDLDHLSVARR